MRRRKTVTNNEQEARGWSTFAADGPIVLKAKEEKFIYVSSGPPKKITPYYLWKRITGTMLYLQIFINNHPLWLNTFINSFFRSIGQVLFVNSPLAGAFFLAAAFYDSPFKGVLASVGVACSVTFAFYLKLDRNSIENGIFGYSGYLIGAALGTFHFSNWESMPWIFAIDVILSCFSVFILLSLGSTVVKTYGLSPLVFPFLIPIYLWILSCTGGSFKYFPLNGGVITPATAVAVNSQSLPSFSFTLYSPQQVSDAFFLNISQTLFQSNMISSILIIVGLFIASPMACITAMLGSLTSILACFLVGIPGSSISTGLTGFNGVLAGIAIGGFFFPLRKRRILFVISAPFLSTLCYFSFGSLLNPFGLPVSSLPYMVIVYIYILASRNIKGLNEMKLQDLSIHEDHVRRIRLIKKVEEVLPCLLINGFTPEEIKSLVIPLLLNTAAAEGNVNFLKKMTQSVGLNINGLDYDSRGVLHMASSRRLYEVVDFALSINANANITDHAGVNPLDEALEARDDKMIRFLVQKGAHCCYDDMDKHGFAFCDAAFKNDIQKIKLMVLCKLDVNSPDYNGRRALHIAASEGHVQMVQVLIKLGAMHSLKDSFNRTALDDANDFNQQEVVDFLLSILRSEKMTTDNVIEPIRKSSFSLFRTKSNFSEVEIIESKSRGSVQNFFSRFSKSSIIKEDSDEAESEPVLEDVSVDEEEKEVLLSKDQRNFLKATDKADREHFERLLIAPILCLTSKSGNLDKFNRLMVYFSEKFPGTDFTKVVDYDSRSVLHLACSDGQVGMTSMLLSAGAEPNMCDVKNRTALQEILNMPDILTLMGDTYESNQCRDITKLLSAHGALMVAVDEKGIPKLHFNLINTFFRNVQNNNVWKVEKFLRYCGNQREIFINMEDYDKRTPLHIAVTSKNVSVKMIKLLLVSGADTTRKDRYNKTPLELAKDTGNLIFLDILNGNNGDNGSNNTSYNELNL